MFIIRFLFWHSSFKKLICFSRRPILLLSLFSVRSGILLRATFFISALTPKISWIKKFCRFSNLSDICAIWFFFGGGVSTLVKSYFSISSFGSIDSLLVTKYEIFPLVNLFVMRLFFDKELYSLSFIVIFVRLAFSRFYSKICRSRFHLVPCCFSW